MIINELLVEKYRTQKILDEMANHDLTQYVSDAHARIKELSTQFGLKLEYGKPDPSSQKIPRIRIFRMVSRNDFVHS